MHDAAHRGEMIRELCQEPLGLIMTDAARALDATRKALSELLNGWAGVSPAMALRLAMAFEIGWRCSSITTFRARMAVKLDRVRRVVEHDQAAS